MHRFRPFVWIALLLATSAGLPRIRGSSEPLREPDPNAAPGLHVDLRARDARTTFHLYESIPLEMAIWSSAAQAYSIELDAGWNAVAGDVEFVVSPADETVTQRDHTMFSCCSNHRAFLTTAPEVFRHYLTDYIRFLRPGSYQVQYRTREVFRGAGLKKDMYRDKGDIPAWSNVLTLTILPDDPTWDDLTLKNALSVLGDEQRARILEADRMRISRAVGPQRQREPRVSRLPGPAATRYLDADRALASLDTEKAIRERVRRLELPSERDWRLTKGNGYQGIDGHLARLTTRPDLLVAALAARASAPDFGVQVAYAALWIEALARRNSPLVFSGLRDDTTGPDVPADYRDAMLSARATVREALQLSLERKRGVAREMTADAIQLLQR